jgi:hypothetical protein
MPAPSSCAPLPNLGTIRHTGEPTLEGDVLSWRGANIRVSAKMHFGIF